MLSPTAAIAANRFGLGARPQDGATIGNDPRGWLEGWHPEVLQAQRIAGDRTSREEDFAAGRVPILYLQPDHDPLAHVEDATAYKEQFAERVTIVVIERSSHAVIAEQPDAVSAALISYARELWPDESGG